MENEKLINQLQKASPVAVKLKLIWTSSSLCTAVFNTDWHVPTDLVLISKCYYANAKKLNGNHSNQDYTC